MKQLKYLLPFAFCLLPLFLPLLSRAASILIPMDDVQKDHLKSYGVAFWVLTKGKEVDWLLNYRGGSFLANYDKSIENECNVRGISYEVIADAQTAEIINQVSDPSVNMDVIKLEKAPRIAVYAPKGRFVDIDDAVIIVLKYAEIPFDVIYDDEILKGALYKYDWLHLHHEDFTGQYSKNTRRNEKELSFLDDKKIQEATARMHGFQKVSKMKLAVARLIRNYCAGGGFLFAMCSGADSFDIALAAGNTDICDAIYDGDAADPDAQSKLDFSQTLAFQNFEVDVNPLSHRFSDIDVGRNRHIPQSEDFFTLFDFSAKWDVVPSMLTQDHDRVIKGFRGLATAFNISKLKPGVTIMGEMKSNNEARYIHGEYGKGQWTFYGGHDPEGYLHNSGDTPTDLSLHPNSPGYRLILNNVLFPAARRKKQKT
jgi:hypothetical protein